MNGQQDLDLPGLDDQPIWVVVCRAFTVSLRTTKAKAERLRHEIEVLGGCREQHTVEIAHGPADRAETGRNEGDDECPTTN